MKITPTQKDGRKVTGSRWLLLFLFAISLTTALGQNKNKPGRYVIDSYSSFRNRFGGPKDANARTLASTIRLPLGNNEFLNGTLNTHQSKGDAETFAGSAGKDKDASFIVRFLNGKAEGKIVLYRQKKAYRYFSDAQGNISVEPADIHDLLCIDYPAPPSGKQASAATSLSVTVPLLQSVPGAPAVIYLDFDGQYVQTPHWNNGVPIDATPTNKTSQEMQDIWEQVSEDYRPFNVNITTDSAIYKSTPLGKRTRVIVTNTSSWFTNTTPAGGVAWLGSFSNTQDDIPCWVFEDVLYQTKYLAECASHEAGHTLGLHHDGRNIPGQGTEVYYGGQGVWVPIMGVSYYRNVSQWSIGEYQYANEQEDDIAIISGPTNGFGFRTDDHANVNTGATSLVKGADGHIRPADNKGIISTRTDVDVFTITTQGGYVYLDVRPHFLYPNLNIRADLYNASNTLVATSNPADALNAPFSFNNLAAGTYYLRIDGVGEGDPFTEGYSDYSSLGAYTISGVVTTPACTITAWSASQAYNAGNQVSYNNTIYSAKWYTQGENPSTSNAWQLVGPCGTNQKPVAVITAPSSNAWYTEGDSIKLAVTATDANGSISRIEIFQNDTLVSTQFDAPFTYARANVSGGKHRYQVIAYDNNNDASAPVFVAVNVNALPVGRIVAPGNGDFLLEGSTFNILVAAGDPDGSISRVEFFLSGQQSSVKIGEVTAPPYSISAVVPAPGSRSYAGISAIITDDKGAKSYAYSYINVASAQGPVVTISNPADNSVFAPGSNIDVIASVSSPLNADIARVEFYENNLAAAAVYSAPFQYTKSNASSGTYTVRAIATDVNGRKGVSSYITFRVGNTNQLPVVTITTPSPGAYYKTGGTITIVADVSDQDGAVTQVEIYSPHIANSSVILTTPPFAATFVNLPSSGIRGATSFVVKATDNTGSISSAAIDLLENKAPVVSINSPANNGSVNAGTNVTISVSPVDQDGTISRVEFYDAGSLLVASVTTSPYNYTLPSIAAGSYTYSVVAYDNLGVASATASVSFTAVSQCTVPVWNASTAYSSGQRVSYNGTIYEARWWTQGSNPDSNSGSGGAWLVIGPCTAKLASADTEDLPAADVKASGTVSVSPVPMEDVTRVEVLLPASGLAEVSVYDITGMVVATLAREYLTEGYHEFRFTASDLPSGLYVIRVTAPEYHKAITVSKK